MPQSSPKLIIVPGIGDDTQVYYSFARRWNRLGYDAHVISFKWVDIHAALEKSMEAFLQQLDQYRNEPVYMIGISAGGTAVVNALALRANVQKVITVCSPLAAMPNLRNPLLIESIAQVENNLAALPNEQKRRILSVHAVYDQVVNTKLSLISSIRSKRIPCIIHAPTIFVAMTLYAHSLRRFLRQT